MYTGRVFIGSDHAGFKLKSSLGKFLSGEGYDIVDIGPSEYDANDDYPDYAEKVSRKVAESGGRGIMICGSGLGSCISANKIRGVRAVTCWNVASAVATRKDNDSNVLCLGERLIKPGIASKIAKAWLDEPFSGEERHARRIGKIKKLEEGTL